MRLLTRLIAVAFCGALVAPGSTAIADDCVETQHLERPPGATVADFQKDNDACFAQAKTQDDYVNCMLAKGYKLVAGKPTYCPP
jgi:hypothetical protein